MCDFFIFLCSITYIRNDACVLWGRRGWAYFTVYISIQWAYIKQAASLVSAACRDEIGILRYTLAAAVSALELSDD